MFMYFSALRPERAKFPAAARNEVAAFRRRRAENSILTLASKKESLRSHVCQPRLRLGTFLILLATGRNILFLLSGRKALTFWPLRETKLPLCGTVEQKNSIQTMASKKESLRSHVLTKT